MNELRFRSVRAALLAHVEFPELALYCLNDARIYDTAEPWVLAPDGAYPASNLARRRPIEGAQAAEPEPRVVEPGHVYVIVQQTTGRKGQVAARAAEARQMEVELRRANQELADELRETKEQLIKAARWVGTAATVAEHLRPFFEGHVGADNVVWAAEHVAEMLDESRERAKDARAEAVLSAAEAATLRDALDGLLNGDAERARAALAAVHPRAQQIAAQAERLEQLGPLLRAVVRWAEGRQSDPSLLDAVKGAGRAGLLDGLEGEQG